MLTTGRRPAGSFRLRLPARIPRWLPLLVAVLVAVALRAAWIGYSEFRPLPDDDAFRYQYFAEQLAAGRGFVHLNGLATAFWPPGYPILLSGFYKAFTSGFRLAQALNVLAAAGTVVLTYHLARTTLGRRTAFPAAVIVALWPSLIFVTAVTLSETVFTFLLLLALFLLLREGGGGRPRPLPLVAAGAVIGFSALVRGQALLLPLAALPFWLVAARAWRPSLLRLAAVGCAALAVVLPWTVRNRIQMGSFVLISTNGGVDLWIGHHPGASGRGQFADELVYSHPELDSRRGEVQVNEDGYRKALSFAVHHPLTEAVLPFKKLYWLYYNDEEGLKWNDGHGGHPFLGENVRQGLLLLSDGYYFAILGFVVLGLPRWLTLRHPGRLLLLCVIAYWTAVHLVFFGDPRFHLPVLPLIAIGAAVPWAVLWRDVIPARAVVVAGEAEC